MDSCFKWMCLLSVSFEKGPYYVGLQIYEHDMIWTSRNRGKVLVSQKVLFDFLPVCSCAAKKKSFLQTFGGGPFLGHLHPLHSSQMGILNVDFGGSGA